MTQVWFQLRPGYTSYLLSLSSCLKEFKKAQSRGLHSPNLQAINSLCLTFDKNVTNTIGEERSKKISSFQFFWSVGVQKLIVGGSFEKYYLIWVYPLDLDPFLFCVRSLFFRYSTLAQRSQGSLWFIFYISLHPDHALLHISVSRELISLRTYTVLSQLHLPAELYRKEWICINQRPS